MADYVAKLKWSLGDGALVTGGYNVNHRVKFAGGYLVSPSLCPWTC